MRNVSMRKPKLWVFSNIQFNNLMREWGWDERTLPDNVAIVSICTPGWIEDGEGHWFGGDNPHVMNLDFDDVDDFAGENGDTHGMSNEQADSLYDFIEAHVGCDFYVHCSAGISRSQAVARYLMDCHGDVYTLDCQRADNKCVLPNLHVLRLLRSRYMNRQYFPSMGWENMDSDKN